MAGLLLPMEAQRNRATWRIFMQRVQGRTTAGTGMLAALFVIALIIAPASGADPKQDNGHPGKTTICHHTSSATNPWVKIRVSNSSLKAHARHGDLIPAPASGCPSGDDDGGGDGGGGLPT
jgi:hypothetical protein